MNVSRTEFVNAYVSSYYHGSKSKCDGCKSRPENQGDRRPSLVVEDAQSKDMVSMDTDPVCGMTVQRETTFAVYSYRDETYYFCAPAC